jgi:uncharacterized protein with ATP-grasp and redox domains
MNTCLDCIPCFIRQALDSARTATRNESIHEQIIRDVLDMTHKMDLRMSPPQMACHIHRRLRQLLGDPDPYHAAKQKHNRLAEDICRRFRPLVAASDNPLQTAVRLAIAGNIIDLGVKSAVSDSEIDKTVQQSLTAPFDYAVVDELRADAAAAKNILYLTDNAGEIVFDRLLLEHLPASKITVAVKGAPVINDATMEDAAAVGLTDMVKVIDNGTDVPGTVLDMCSEAFVEQFNRADFVIAKGQGNYETLSHVDKDIYFILKAKCHVVASQIGCPVGQMLLIHNRPRKARAI